MEERSRETYLGIDFPYIFRSLWKNVFIIVMCACIAGVLSYVFLDNYQKDTYTASVNLAVIARDNSSGKLSEYNVGAAVKRCLNVLNSDMLRDQVNKAEAEYNLSGDFSAARVGSSNIITMKATSGSAENAFRLLKASVEAYPSLSSYFETGYLLKTLDSISADNIVTNHARNGFYALAAALLVFCGGVGLTGGICFFTDKIHSREQAEAILDMDILGVQHYIKKKDSQKAILISDKETDISYSEEMDKLVTRIREKMHDHQYKVLMVSSIKENEGKSTIAANIALSLARRGKKVALMEGDLRRPALYKIFDKEVDEDKQFIQYLQGKEELAGVLESGISDYGINCVFQGQAVGDPDKLLESDAFKAAVEQMRCTMDYVIIDTPPIGIVRDAEIVAGCADAVLLILKQDYVKGAAVNDVVDILEDTGAAVLGGVLTMARGKDIVRGHKGHYGKYYYGYGYGKE